MLLSCSKFFQIFLQNIVIGYKINSAEYFIINEILAIIGFSIYKTYFLSESRAKKIDTFLIFCNEFRKLTNFLTHESEFSTFDRFIRDINNFLDSYLCVDHIWCCHRTVLRSTIHRFHFTNRTALRATAEVFTNNTVSLQRW